MDACSWHLTLILQSVASAEIQTHQTRLCSVQCCWVFVHCSLRFIFLAVGRETWCGTTTLRLDMFILLTTVVKGCYCKLPVNSNQSGHSPLNSLFNKMLLMNCCSLDICFPTPFRDSRDCCECKCQEIISFTNDKTVSSDTNNHTKVTEITFSFILMWTFTEAPDVYLQDFMYCTAATWLGDWVLAWISRCTGAYNNILGECIWINGETINQTISMVNYSIQKINNIKLISKWIFSNHISPQCEYDSTIMFKDVWFLTVSQNSVKNASFQWFFVMKNV